MKPIEYPSKGSKEFAVLVNDYMGIFATDLALSLQKNTTQSHKLQNDQGKTMIAKDSFVPLL